VFRSVSSSVTDESKAGCILFLTGTRVPATPGVNTVGFVFFLRLVNCPEILFTFRLFPPKLESDLLSSSGSLLFSISSSTSISCSPLAPNLCLLLFPVGTTRDPVLTLVRVPGTRDPVFLVPVPPVLNLDRTRPLAEVIGNSVSVSLRLSWSSFTNFTLFLPLPRPPDGSKALPRGCSLFCPRNALPVSSTSGSAEFKPGILLKIPETETGSTEREVVVSGSPGSRTSGVRELEKVTCSTERRGGKIPACPPGLFWSVLKTENGRGLGLNRNLLCVASPGLNFSKLVTAGTVGTLSLGSELNGRGLGC